MPNSNSSEPVRDETAVRLLADYAEKVAPDRLGREKAAEMILAEVLALNGAFGFEVQRDKSDPNSVFLLFSHQGVRITSMAGGKLRIARDAMSPSTEVTGLAFNRGSGQFVSTRDDDRYAPKFGEPVTRKRTAVAEVVAQALRVLSSD